MNPQNPEKFSPRRVNLILLILLLLYPLIGMGIDLIAPSLPAISHDLGVSSTISKNLITLYLFGYAAGNFLIGFLSDTLGRRKLLMVSLLVLGNITVGGTGKTPLVIALARILAEHGYKPGIVSRGYGGQAATTPQRVTAGSNPLETGDEALLMARLSLCPLVIARRRVAAVTTLLNHYPCDIILSDDGLQHYAMGRTIEIAVVDGARRFGNGLCLPAGPLREPLSRLKSVDFVVTQGDPHPGEWAMRLLPGSIYNLRNPEQKLPPSGNLPPIHAVAGIGNPQRFFTQLEQLGFTVIAHPFPDHYHFRPQDIDFGENTITIMTEKDAVKCEKFADERHWCLPVTASCDSTFLDLLLERLRTGQGGMALT